jgi:preprotein translocase subunit SecE
VGAKVDPFVSQAEETKPPKTAFIRDLKEELRKVTWTPKEELLFCTKIVVASTFLLGIGIYLVDLLIKGVLNGIAGLVHLIFG